MGGKGKDIDDMKVWSKANEVTLIKILVGKVREGKLQSLKGKFNRLRIKYRQFSELIGHTEVKWDVTSDIVHESQDIWEGFFKENKEFKKFKKTWLQILCITWWNIQYNNYNRKTSTIIYQRSTISH
ncbi:hypothetical protein GQ457_10G014400 [Hibiscus cannabinus]